MTKEKWTEILGLIKDRFEIISESETEDEIGDDSAGSPAIEKRKILEFNSPIGKTRLIFSERPIVLDKKTNYSHRIGGDTGIKYVFSPDEFSCNLKVYTWNEATGDWFEVKAETLDL